MFCTQGLLYAETSDMHRSIQVVNSWPCKACFCIWHLLLVACPERTAELEAGALPNGPMLPGALGCLGPLTCRLPASMSLMSPDPAQPAVQYLYTDMCTCKGTSSPSCPKCADLGKPTCSAESIASAAEVTLCLYVWGYWYYLVCR